MIVDDLIRKTNWKNLPQDKPLKVLLALNSLFLSEMFAHALIKMHDIKVLKKVSSIRSLSSSLAKDKPDWAIVPLNQEGNLPQRFSRVIKDHPETRFLAVSPTLRIIKVKWEHLQGDKEKTIHIETMDQLNDVLLGYPPIKSF